MKWLLIIPALPVAAYLIVCAISLYNSSRWPECTACGGIVPTRGNIWFGIHINERVPGWDVCPLHGNLHA